MKRLLALLPLTLVLAACAAGPASLGKVTTIDELKDAYIAAGGVCNWQQTDKVQNALASGTCSDSSVLMIFDDADFKTTTVGVIREFPPVNLLVGENWIINAPGAGEMEAALGGTYYGD